MKEEWHWLISFVNVMKVTIAGATGLVGSKILEILLLEPRIEKIFAFARKVQKRAHPKLEWIIGELPPGKMPKADALILAIGTTIAKAGSKEVFHQTDVELPFLLATQAKNTGYEHVLNISAKGASPKSSVFFNREKAELEKRLIEIGFKKTVFVRPGLLLGDRTENRPGEKIGQFIFRNINFLLPSSLKAVKAEDVAKALTTALLSNKNGTQIIENEKIVSGSESLT